MPSQYHFPQLDLNKDDPDLRYMALFDLGRKLSSGTYEESSAVEATIRTLCHAISDPSEAVRNQAMSLVGPVLKACPFPRAMEYFLRDLRPHIVLQDNSFSDLLQVYRDIILSTPLSKESDLTATVKPVDRQFYQRIINGYLLASLVGAFEDFDYRQGDGHLIPRVGHQRCLYVNAPSDAERSTVLELVVSVISLCGKGLTDENVTVIFSTCWEVIMSDRAALALRTQAIRALVSVCRYTTPLWFTSIVDRTVGLLQGNPISLTATRNLLLLLKGLVVSYPVKFVPSMTAILSVAQTHCRAQQFEYKGDDDVQLELYINVTEAALSLYEVMFLTYSRFLPLSETVMASYVTLNFLAFNPGMMDGFEEMDDPLIEDDDEYEEELGFGDVGNFSWRLRVTAAKFLRSLVQTRAEKFRDSEVGSLVVKALCVALKDRFSEVALHAAATLSVMVRVIYSPAPVVDYSPIAANRKRRRESNAQGTNPIADFSTLDVPTQRAIFDGVVHITRGDSLAAKKEALILLTVAIESQGLHGWDTFHPAIQPVLELLRKADIQARRLGGTYAVEALGVIRAMITTYGPDKMNLFAVQIGEVVTIVVNDSSPAVTTAVLSLISTLFRTFNQKFFTARQALIDQLTNIVLDHSKSQTVPAAVSDFAAEALSQFLASEIPLGHELGRSAMQIILDRLTRDLGSQSAFKAVMTASSASLPDLFYLEWVEKVLEIASSKYYDSSTTSQASGFILTKKGVSNPQIAPILRGKPDLVEQIAAKIIPFLDSIQSEDNMPALQSLEILASLAKDFFDIVYDVENFPERVLDVILKSKLQSPQYSSVIALAAEFGKHPLGRDMEERIYRSWDSCVSIPLAGRAMGNLIVSTGGKGRIAPEHLQMDVEALSADERRKTMAIVALGEIGYLAPSAVSDTLPPDQVLRNIGPNGMSIELQIMVAIALGRAAVGDPFHYLPAILGAMKMPGNPANDDDEGYSACIHSLAEFAEQANLGEATATTLQFLSEIWEMALKTALELPKARPAAVRCMGSLMLHQPTFFEQARTLTVTSPEPAVRGMGISILEFWILHQDRDCANVPVLTSVLETAFLSRLSDDDVKNREYAMLAINAVSYRYPDAVAPIISKVLKLVVDAMNLKDEFVREVRMGPFLRKFDDALGVRKAAYEVLYTLIGNHDQEFEFVDLFDRCTNALIQDEEVRVPACLIIEQIWDSVFDPIKRGESWFRTRTRMNFLSRMPGDRAESLVPTTDSWAFSDLSARKIRTLSPNELDLLATKRVEALCDAIRIALDIHPDLKGANLNTAKSSQVDQHGEHARQIACIRLAFHIYRSLAHYYDLVTPQSSLNSTKSTSANGSSSSARRANQQHHQHGGTGVELDVNGLPRRNPRFPPLVVDLSSLELAQRQDPLRAEFYGPGYGIRQRLEEERAPPDDPNAGQTKEAIAPPGMVCATRLWDEVRNEFDDIAYRVENGAEMHP